MNLVVIDGFLRVHFRAPSATTKGLYVLKEEFYNQYNLFFHHYMKEEQSKVRAARQGQPLVDRKESTFSFFFGDFLFVCDVQDSSCVYFIHSQNNALSREVLLACKRVKYYLLSCQNCVLGKEGLFFLRTHGPFAFWAKNDCFSCTHTQTSWRFGRVISAYMSFVRFIGRRRRNVVNESSRPCLHRVLHHRLSQVHWHLLVQHVCVKMVAMVRCG